MHVLGYISQAGQCTWDARQWGGSTHKCLPELDVGQASIPEVLESGEEGLWGCSGEDADIQALQLLLLHAPQSHGPHII